LTFFQMHQFCAWHLLLYLSLTFLLILVLLSPCHSYARKLNSARLVHHFLGEVPLSRYDTFQGLHRCGPARTL
jgi:hypothetical protein